MNSDIRSIDLNLLVTLNTLLEERNVSRSAERLALTQPTISGQLMRLRAAFNDPLFVRTQHGMLPTPRAEALAPALEKLLSDAKNLVAAENFSPTSAQMDFRVAASDYMQSTILVPFLTQMRKQAPHARLATYSPDVPNLERKLARGELDLVIIAPSFVDPTLRTEHLYREEYVCAVRENHPLSGKQLTLDKFVNYDHIMVSLSEGHFKSAVDDILATHKTKRRVSVSVPSFLILLEMLQADDLIALVPKRLLKGRAHSLRLLKPPVELEGFDVVAAWHSRAHHDPAHQWLRDTIKKSCALR